MAEDYWTKNVDELLQDSYQNTGSMFVNGSKKSEKHPDYQGLQKFGLEIEGQQYTVVLKVSGWVKLSEGGKKWISLKVMPMATVKSGDIKHAEENQ